MDLRTQTKSVDFSGATTTKPFKSGTTLPATCGVGEAFFKTNAAAGSNWYACTAVNAWTLQSGSPTLAGDVTGSTNATVVTQIQGRPVSSTAPSSGQSLAWNSSTSTWTPQTVAGAQGPAGPTGPTGATGPAGPTGAAGATGATGLTGAQGPAGPAGTPGAPGATGATGPQGPQGPSGVSTLSGDVTGSASATVVTQIQGRPISSTAPSSGQSLAWNSSTSAWAPQTVAGAQGPAGPTGPTGATGPAGPTGPAGATGATGLTGAQGPAGAAGATGATGPQGPAGATGASGAIAKIQNAGTNLPVEATLNFTGGGCTDNPGAGRTDCTGSGGISGLTIATNGTTQATQSTLNFISGTGIVQTCANNAGANRVDCTPSLNTSVVLTISVAQAGTPTFCNSTNGTTGYACTFGAAKVLTAYNTGMFIVLRPDTSNSGACSLNIDSLGVKSIKQNDGATDPASGAIVAGKFYWLFFDGTVWRMQ